MRAAGKVSRALMAAMKSSRLGADQSSGGSPSHTLIRRSGGSDLFMSRTAAKNLAKPTNAGGGTQPTVSFQTFAEFGVGNGFTGQVAVDDLLLTAGAKFDHHVANVARKARVPHDSRVEVHLRSEAVGVAQGYDRVVLERPEHAVERWLDYRANSTRSGRSGGGR
jgi:hypothetical protein